MSDPVIELAEKLGAAIVAHPVAQALVAAQEQLRSDTEAQQLLQSYQQTAQKLQNLQASGQPIEPEMKKELSACESAMASQDTLKQLMRVQADFQEFSARIHGLVDAQLAQQLSGGNAAE